MLSLRSSLLEHVHIKIAYLVIYVQSFNEQYFTLINNANILFKALKYWRFRTLLLPLYNPATKQIMEDETTHCDIYPTPTRHDLDQLTDGFLKMTEQYFNKVKRPNKQRVSMAVLDFISKWQFTLDGIDGC